MVIRGRTRGNGVQLADYLMSQAGNESVELFDIRGTSQPDNIRKSLLEMSLTSELTKSHKGLYHAQINPSPTNGEDKRMSAEDWLKAADLLEQELKLENQKRVIVLHTKKSRIHAHVIWERYDHDKGRMISDSFSRYAQNRARQKMETLFEQKALPEKNLRRPEMKKTLTELWQQTWTGKEFIQKAAEAGYTIARGEQRRPFMVVDAYGRSYDLVRQLENVRTKEVKEILAFQKMPTEKQAIEAIRKKQKASNINQAQDKATDKLAERKQKRKEEQAQFFAKKRSEMKVFGKELTTDATDKAINQSQEKAIELLTKFKNKQPEPIEQESDRERRIREMKEQFEENTGRPKRKDKGLGYG